MASGDINQIRRDRKLLLKALKGLLKDVDSRLEVSERLLNRLYNRKNKILTLEEYQELATEATTIDNALNQYVAGVKQGINAMQI
jgi:hypothetical protein